jgi:hypothetical protein
MRWLNLVEKGGGVTCTAKKGLGKRTNLKKIIFLQNERSLIE